jgi:hypothetical protein
VNFFSAVVSLDLALDCLWIFGFSLSCSVDCMSDCFGSFLMFVGVVGSLLLVILIFFSVVFPEVALLGVLGLCFGCSGVFGWNDSWVFVGSMKTKCYDHLFCESNAYLVEI